MSSGSASSPVRSVVASTASAVELRGGRPGLGRRGEAVSRELGESLERAAVRGGGEAVGRELGESVDRGTLRRLGAGRRWGAPGGRRAHRPLSPARGDPERGRGVRGGWHRRPGAGSRKSGSVGSGGSSPTRAIGACSPPSGRPPRGQGGAGRSSRRRAAQRERTRFGCRDSARAPARPARGGHGREARQRGRADGCPELRKRDGTDRRLRRPRPRPGEPRTERCQAAGHRTGSPPVRMATPASLSARRAGFAPAR